MAAGAVGVLTFHRCVNYGSYWQARCLLEWLARRGRPAVLLDHASDAARRAEIRCALSPLHPQPTRPEDVPSYVQKIRGFRRAVESLPRTRRFPLDKPQQALPFDLILIGSDEVFNLRHPWYGGAPAFFGEGFRAARRVAYAASFGNTGGAALDPFWGEKLKSFSALSVRDQTGQKLIHEAGLAVPQLVLDPCLLNPPAPAEEDRVEQPFVAVYGHSFPDWYARAITDWARRSQLKLVSIGYRNAFADEQRIEADPETFRMLMSQASAVATSFFHGSVFAVLNQKPFACVATSYRQNKLRDLCALLGLEERLAQEPRAVRDALGTPPGAETYRRIAELRAGSEAFLDRALG